jgi:hypothetical protein
MENEKKPKKTRELTEEDVEMIRRDIDYSLEQIQYYIDAYIASSVILHKGYGEGVRKELNRIVSDYIKNTHAMDWAEDE